MEFDTIKGMMNGESSTQEKKFSTYLQLVNAMEEEEGRTVNIIKFIRDTQDMSREAIQSFAEENGMEVAEIDERLYNMMRSLIMRFGKHNEVPDSEFDSEQLQAGVDMEQEHTDDPLVAKMIAKDHLAEIPDYYSRLADMESEAGAGEMEDFEASEDEMFAGYNLDDDGEVDLDAEELGSEEEYNDSEGTDDESENDELFPGFNLGDGEELDFDKEDEYDPSEKVHKGDNKKPFRRIS